MSQVNIQDTRRWIPDPGTGYTVSGVYRLITMRPPPTEHVPEALLWRKEVPLKIIVFTLRLCRLRLPTKSNLFCRGIKSEEAQLCVTGCGFQETENHLFFLSCSVFGQIWQLCEIGFVFTLLILIILLIILFSLVTFLAAQNLGIPSCIWFGLFRRKETAKYFAVKRTIHCSF